MSGIGVIGVGYVGLPLAVELSKHYAVVAYDVDAAKIDELKKGRDVTGSYSEAEILALDGIAFTTWINDIGDCTCFIVTVPTPVNSDNSPDLSMLKNALIAVSTFIKPLDLVVVESTVYPGVTRDVCGSILEANSGLKISTAESDEANRFYLGYSPERINPGDKAHTLRNVVKIVACEDPRGLGLMADIYGSAVDAGLHLMPSLDEAEAAKVIENCQRDLNIAFINQVNNIFTNCGLNSSNILKAAGTKWNFLPFHPGLVGGHCIGIDPYYFLEFARKSEQRPSLVSTARQINEELVDLTAHRILNLAATCDASLDILVLGAAFKANVRDFRNSKVLDLIESLQSGGASVSLHDPLIADENLKAAVDDCVAIVRSDDLLNGSNQNLYSIIVFAVGHDRFFDRNYQELIGVHRERGGKVFDISLCLSAYLTDVRI